MAISDKDLIILKKPDPISDNILDRLGIPYYACNICTLKCGETGLRCNYFLHYYDREVLSYDKEKWIH